MFYVFCLMIQLYMSGCCYVFWSRRENLLGNYIGETIKWCAFTLLYIASKSKATGICEWCVPTVHTELGWRPYSALLPLIGTAWTKTRFWLCVIVCMYHLSCYSKKIKIHIFLFECLVIKCNSLTAAIFSLFPLRGSLQTLFKVKQKIHIIQ